MGLAAMTVDIDFALKLNGRLTEVIDASKESLVGALEFREYTLACGMIEAWKQIRDVMIPETLDEIQRK
jgi:hypothetical protein